MATSNHVTVWYEFGKPKLKTFLHLDEAREYALKMIDEMNAVTVEIYAEADWDTDERFDVLKKGNEAYHHARERLLSDW